jgi:hypothetical protein
LGRARAPRRHIAGSAEIKPRKRSACLEPDADLLRELLDVTEMRFNSPAPAE